MKRLFTLLSLLIIAQWTFGQLSGDKYIPGDYGTIAEAVTDLNAQGVTGGGGVTFYVAAGHSETTTAPITILSTVIGSASDPIVFQKDGDGANPVISRTDGGTNNTTSIGALGDAVIRLDGTDYVTFNGIDVTASSSGIEYGYFTYKPSGTNGCQYVTITNCSVTMTKANSGMVLGIYISNGATSTSSATGVTVTAESGRNAYVLITGNTVQNVHSGVFVRGSSAAGFYDLNVSVGTSGAGNIIQNYGGGSATSAYGIYFFYQTNPSAEYNTINNAGGGGTSHNSTLYGIFYSTTLSGNVTGNNNEITLANTSASSTTQFIHNNVTVTSNTFNNNTFSAGTISSTGTVYLISASSGTPNTTVSGNQTVGTINRTGASGTFYCFYNLGSPGSGSENFFNNSFTNITLAGSTSFGGYYSNTASGHTQNVYGNTISAINMSTGTFNGIYALSANTKNIYNNTVNNITSSGTIYGINNGGGNPSNIYNNEIYNLTTNSTTAFVDGILISTGTVKIYNNFIYRLFAPISGSTTAIAGIYISGGTAISVYFNSIYLDATSTGADFGTSGIYASVTPTVELRNNVVINNSVAAGTGYVVAYRRSSNTNLTTYAAASDNNDFYAGPPSATNLIFFDGTTPQQTIDNFKAFVSPRDANSFSENPPFVEVSTAPYDLHMLTDVITYCEGGGSTVTGITDDFDGDTRQDPPDVGADEFDGTPVPKCEGTPAASTISGEDELCANTGTILGLSTTYTDPGISYQWKYSETSGGPYNDIGDNLPVLNTGNLTVNTYYICVITCEFSNESTTTDEFGIIVNALPNVTVNPTSGSYCTPGGTPVTLTASGATSYSWSPAAGLDVTTGAVVNASPAATTTYTVTGTDDNGCENTANVTITVGQSPVISSVTATPSDICPGGTSQLNATASIPTEVKSYAFTAGTGATLDPMDGATTVIASSVDDTPTATPQDIGFTFVFNNVNYTQYSVSPDGWILLGGAAAVSQFTNSVISTTNIPKIYPYWDDLATGTTGNVKTLLTGTAPNRIFIVQWYVTIPRATSGAANSTFQAWLYEGTSAIEFRYGTMGTPSGTSGISSGLTAGSTNFNCITFSNNTASNSTANNANQIAPPAGTIYTFSSPQPTYSWSPASGLIPNASVANPVTPSLYATTEYTVTVSNGGCSAQESVIVSLAETLVASATNPLRCTGDVTTEITGSNTGGAPTFTFTWSPIYDLYEDAAGTIPYDGSALDSPSIYTKAYTSGFTYNLLITDFCGTTAGATSTVSVYPTPTASASSNGPVCTGETLELYGTTDIGTTFSWTGPNGFTSNLQNPIIPDVTLAANGTYYFAATANGCPSIAASVTVEVNQTPTPLTISPAAAQICPGSVQQLDAIGGDLYGFEYSGTGAFYSTTNTPFKGYWGGMKTQNLYLADELSAMGLIAGCSIYSITYWAYTFTSPYTFNDFTIAMKHTTSTEMNTTLETGTQEVLSPSNFTLSGTAPFYITLNLTTPFFWNGTDNLIIETCFNNNNSGGVSGNSAGILCDEKTTYLSAYYSSDNDVDLCPNPGTATRSYYRTLVGLDFSIPGQITWSPWNKLYLDSDATQAYAGEDASTVYAKIYTTGTYTATSTSDEGCTSSATATVTGVDYTVSGTLKYNNNPKTPMNNVTLTLNPGGYTDITDGSGYYQFDDICAGSYTLEVTNINKPVGGINSTDAVQMNVWNANQTPVQHVKFLAGEVDFDGNVFINATDALAVQNYFVFATPFNRADVFGTPWVFWKAGEFILNNNDPNRFLLDIPVDVVASDVTVDLYGQAIGDFSGSFTPGALKGASPTMDLVYTENRIAGQGVAIDLPVRMIKSSSVSAVSLVLNFPAELLEVTGISMDQTEIQPTWSVSGDELRIGWHSTQAMWLKANEELLTIHIVTSNAFSEGDQIRFSLASDPLNEMADGTFEVIPDAVIGTDMIEFSVYGIGEPSDGTSVSLQVRPNPFADYTMLTYGIPVNGFVTLQITDMLGCVVSTPVYQHQTAGTYTLKLDALPLQSGVYTAKITLESNSGDMTRTIRLIRK